MATFQDGLYVGTLNVQFWQNPLGILDLAGGPQAVLTDSEGSEIWKYNGETWRATMKGGFGNVHNKGIRNLFQHIDGRLYAGTVNYINGAEVWRSEDGEQWTTIASNGFGRGQANGSIRGMASFQGKLYVGTENYAFGGEIWAWDGGNWEQVADKGLGNRKNLSIAELKVWNGLLYMFTWNAFGAEIFVYDGQDITRIAAGGIENKLNVAILGVAVYNGRMYVGTANFVSGAELYRSTDGTHFERIATKGLGDPLQAYLWRFLEHRGMLYMGTFQQGPVYGLTKEGGRVYRMDPYEIIEEIVGPEGSLAKEGFNDWRNYGIRTMANYQGKLYMGTAQCFFCLYRPGTNIWELDTRSSKTECASSIW
eukprot:Selendium_serpulae@DN277_c0_g1_i1.p1